MYYIQINKNFVHQVGNRKCSKLFGCPNLEERDPSLFSSTEQQKVIRQNIRTMGTGC